MLLQNHACEHINASYNRLVLKCIKSISSIFFPSGPKVFLNQLCSHFVGIKLVFVYMYFSLQQHLTACSSYKQMLRRTQAMRFDSSLFRASLLRVAPGVWRRSIFGNRNISDSRAEGIKLKSLCSIVWCVLLIISWVSLERVKYCSFNSPAHKGLDSAGNKYPFAKYLFRLNPIYLYFGVVWCDYMVAS